jgi:hypothetical protein
MTGQPICGFLEKEPRQFDLCIINRDYCRKVPEHSVFIEIVCLDLHSCIFALSYSPTLSMSNKLANPLIIRDVNNQTAIDGEVRSSYHFTSKKQGKLHFSANSTSVDD